MKVYDHYPHDSAPAPIIGPRSRPFYKTRADGWPLCPVCGDDELWSHLNWDGMSERPPLEAWIDTGLTCYACNYDSTRMQTPPPTPPAARRYAIRYGVAYCLFCGFAVAYCGCERPDDAVPDNLTMADAVTQRLIARRTGR
jgi:hypothetical protein